MIALFAVYTSYAGAIGAVPSAVQEKARLAVVNRMLSLRGVDVEYSETDDFTPSKLAVAHYGAEHTRLVQGRYDSLRRFSFLAGSVRFEESDSADTVAREEKEHGVHALVQNIFIMTTSRFEIFSKYDGLRASGLIGNPSDHGLLNGHIVDVALGLRGDSPKAGWISAAALKQARFEYDPDLAGAVTVTLPSEVPPLNKWWCSVDGDDVTITKYTYGSSKGEIYREIDCSDFRAVDGGLRLPYKIESKMSSTDLDGKKYCGETVDIQVHEYHQATENTPDRYLMVWPLETKVFDQRTRATFVIRKAPRTLDDDFIAATEQERLRDTQWRLQHLATEPTPSSQP